MIRTVYVVTDVRRPLARRARNLALAAVAWLLLALGLLVESLAWLLGTLDAFIAAALGTRRLAYLTTQLRDAIRASRKDLL